MTRVDKKTQGLDTILPGLHRGLAMLFQISGNAEILNSIITRLSKILGCSNFAMIHTAIMQCRKL